jgi:hypothetical protein
MRLSAAKLKVGDMVHGWWGAFSGQYTAFNPPRTVVTAVQQGSMRQITWDTGGGQVWGSMVDVDVTVPAVPHPQLPPPSGPATILNSVSWDRFLVDKIEAMKHHIYGGYVPVAKPDDKYPHTCPRCKRTAYIGAGTRVLHAPDDREQCK